VCTYTATKREETRLSWTEEQGPSNPTGPFARANGCKIVVADPDFEPDWQELEEGHWRRTCQCNSEDRWEPRADARTRLDPLDPSTFAHVPKCEDRDTTDPKILRAILTVTERESYWFVQCRTCEYGWQVPCYVAESAV
jgi:hypothetical protein